MAETKNRSLATKLILGGLLLTVVILWFSPMYFVIINSLKTYRDVIISKASLPTEPINQGIENFNKILENENLRLLGSFRDSLIITAVSLLFIVMSSSMAAWVLVRSKTKLSSIIFFTFVASMIVPFQVMMLPLVEWFRGVDSVLAPFFGLFSGILGETGQEMALDYSKMIIAYIGFGSGLSIFMYHGFIKSIPVELEEAAIVDGCSPFQVFFNIVFPILKPITITLLILNGMWIWNDFLLPLVMLGTGGVVQTLPVGIANFVGSFVTKWELLMMSLILSIIPIIILFVIGQKHIIKGMVGGSIK